jgi:hypothetical protein
MAKHFLGKTDGRVLKARKAIRKLISWGFQESDLMKLIRWNREHLPGVERIRAAVDGDDQDREKRLSVAQWAIRTMMALGFTESEIAEMVGVHHTTITHVLDPDGPRPLGEETLSNLTKSVEGAGAERLKLLLPRIAIEVLDTCLDSGHPLDRPTRANLATALRISLQNALIFSSAPTPLLPGIHACFAQVGDPIQGLYLINAPPGVHGTLNERLAHMERVEHELEHILQRYREQRKRLAKQKHSDRVLPRDGEIA